MFRRILIYFTFWRVSLFFVAFLAIYFLPVFGARFPYADRVLEITHLPNWIWGFGNFDGVHYLRIAQDGYAAQYSQAFFPLYPILVRIFSYIIPKNPTLDLTFYNDPSYFYSGILLSNVFLLAGLYFFYKLLRLDFDKKTSALSVIFLLAVPTSFYFGAVYAESLFLFLTVLSIYFIRKKKFFLGAIIVAIATATRIFGIFLIPLYAIEALKSKNRINLIWTAISPIGIFAYVLFLKLKFNNPLYFFTSQPVFGASRSVNEIILLPQVIYRYIKIFFSINFASLPFFVAAVEFLYVLIPLVLLIMFFKRMRLSYWIFSVAALIFPTLTGTFSSMPRYALTYMLLLVPYLVVALGKYYKKAAVVLSVLGGILLGLFIRGYWIS
jgi:Gpi18-like mannosyltransferase